MQIAEGCTSSRRKHLCRALCLPERKVRHPPTFHAEEQCLLKDTMVHLLKLQLAEPAELRLQELSSNTPQRKLVQRQQPARLHLHPARACLFTTGEHHTTYQAVIPLSAWQGYTSTCSLRPGLHGSDCNCEG